jgi:endonuclease YncB( thermonuclease family)
LRGLTSLQNAVAISAFAAAAFTFAAHAASISVADGDSFRMDGERYRLQDVDAPELHQMCKDSAGREWACGRQARDELRRLLNQGAVSCRTITKDRFGRRVATCIAGGRDIGESMVRNGWATAYKGRGFSSHYVSAESEARAAKRGLWAGSFETPRQWRQEHPREDARGTILSADAQDWLRQKAQSVSDWFRSLWTKP